mgnify:CR=1 FL=1
MWASFLYKLEELTFMGYKIVLLKERCYIEVRSLIFYLRFGGSIICYTCILNLVDSFLIIAFEYLESYSYL